MAGKVNLERVVVGLCVAVVAAHALVFAYIVASRLTYPFELEWMEGGMLEQALQIRSGHPVYQQPSINYAPFMYTPVFYYATAAMVSVVSNGLIALRSVSLLSTVGSIGLIFLWVRKETGRTFPALLSAGLFVACYSPAGYYFDVGRVDPLALFWLLAGLYLLTRTERIAGAVFAGILLAAAYQTKQAQLVILGASVPLAFLSGAKRGAAFVGSMAIALGTSVLALNAQSGGWYLFYTTKLPSQLDWNWRMLWGYWHDDIFAALPIAFPLAFFHPIRTRRAFCLLLVGVSMVLCSWVGSIHVGGWRNVLLPAFATISIAFGTGYSWLRYESRWFESSMPRSTALAALCLLQFLWIRPNPSSQIPTPTDREAGERVVKAIAAMPGDVWIPDHGYLARMAGKTPFIHRNGMQDLLRSTTREVREPFAKELEDNLNRRRFSTLIMDMPGLNGSGRYAPLAAREYRPAGSLPFAGDDFKTVIGWRLRPEFLFVPK